MLCPPLRPLNRRPNVPNLPDPHRARPSRAAGSFFDVKRPLEIALRTSKLGGETG